MSTDFFNDNPKDTKSATNREQTGLSPGSTPASVGTETIQSYQVSHQEGPIESDVTRTYSGTGSGTHSAASSVGSPAINHGYKTPSGSRIMINGAVGAETIEIALHNGAGIVIDPDGSIFVNPTSRKGFGLHSPSGDGVVSAQNRIVIKGGSSVVVESQGDIQLNSGKNMLFNVGGDLQFNVAGASHIHSDGTITTQTPKDHVTTVGGTQRNTVAGDHRTQVAGNIKHESMKTIEHRSMGDSSFHSQQNFSIMSKGSSSIDSSSKLQLNSNDDLHLSSKGNSYLTATKDISTEANGNLSARSMGHMVMSSKGNFHVDSEQSTTMTSQNVSISSTQAASITGGQSVSMNSAGTMNMNSMGAVDFRGSTIDMQKDVPTNVSMPVIETTTPRNSLSPENAKSPEVPDANTIIDSISTVRIAPDFPHNAKKMSAGAFSHYQNEGDTPNKMAKQEAYKNNGGGSTYEDCQPSSSIGNISSNNKISDNKKQGQQNPYPLPSSHLNANEKLSRNVTVGMFGNLDKCPNQQMGLSKQQILQNAAHLAYNILDPVISHFGSKVTLLPGGAGLRIGMGGSMHYLGKAHDLRASSRDSAETANIAKWIVENLPFDRCFLEANASGSIHVHVEAAPPGSSGRKLVWTCFDPQCHSRVDGLNLSYAQQGLKARSGIV